MPATYDNEELDSTLDALYHDAEIAHARKRGYCLACDHSEGPHTWRRWNPIAGGHTTEDHPGVGPINEHGLCAGCEAKQ